MQQKIRKPIGILLSLVMLLSVFGGLTLTASAEETYAVGDIIEFGGYPQSQVTDTDVVSQLDALVENAEWISYNYYSGDGNYGSMQPGDWMNYCDIELNDTIYRGVRFTRYRPNYTYDSNTGSSTDTYQDDNGYNTDTTYWFKWESLVWRILDPAAGLVLCENIIDSQAYSNTIYSLSSNYYNEPTGSVYANDYESSSIRQWLINDFYNTAFSASEQANIAFTPLDNNAYETSYSQYNSNPTNDKIFLLSWNDVLSTSYGFNSNYRKYDTARRAEGSDYAKCQGLWVSTYLSYKGNSDWRLRSAGYNSYGACFVSSNGTLSSAGSVYRTCYGVRPALKFSSGIIQSSNPNGGYTPAVTVCEHANVQVVDPIPATCTTDGNTGYTICLDCDEIVSGENTVIPATGHSYSTPADTDWTWTKSGDTYTATVTVNCEKNDDTQTLTATVGEPVVVNATHLEDGSITYTATATIGEQTFTATKTDVIEAEGHNLEHHVAVASTKCTETGTVEYWHCTVCEKNYTDETAETEITDLSDHIPGDHAWGAWTDNGDGTHTRVCGNDASHVETNDHNFGEYVYNDDATCTEDGTKTAVCADCGATDTIADPAHPATGHAWGEWTVTKTPTCTETGTRIRTCSHDSTHIQTESIPTVDHVDADHVDADHDNICDNCGKTLHTGFRCSWCDKNDHVQADSYPTIYKIVYRIIHFFIHLIQWINWLT